MPDNGNPQPEPLAPIVIDALVTAAHTVDDHWPHVEADSDVRRITRLTANLFNALVDGNPVAAGDAIHGIDNIYTRTTGAG